VAVAIELKAGVRLRSAVDDVEVVVVKAPGDAVDLRCGGHPMAVLDEAGGASANVMPGFDKGSLLGKRYVDEDGTLEVLCTKAGSSSLSTGDAPLGIKDAKPLPSSD
jgi:hypothetical protein